MKTLGLRTLKSALEGNDADGLPSFRSVRLNVPRTGMSTRVQMKYP